METFGDKQSLMVEYQLRRRGVADERVLEAMGTVPRHAFVPDKLKEMAYTRTIRCPSAADRPYLSPTWWR